MSTGNLFHAFGPATENARSEDLFVEQINPVSLPSVVLHDQGCRPQKLPVQSNTMVLDHWWHGAPEFRVCNLFALKLAANAVRTEPVTRGHVVSSPWPIEQQRWKLFEVELTLRPASEPARSYINPALKWQRRIPISRSHTRPRLRRNERRQRRW